MAWKSWYQSLTLLCINPFSFYIMVVTITRWVAQCECIAVLWLVVTVDGVCREKTLATSNLTFPWTRIQTETSALIAHQLNITSIEQCPTVMRNIKIHCIAALTRQDGRYIDILTSWYLKVDNEVWHIYINGQEDLVRLCEIHGLMVP